MKTLLLLCFLALLSTIGHAQVTVSAGLKVGLVNFTDIGENIVGCYQIDAFDSGNRFAYQLYGRLQVGPVFFQPEFRRFRLQAFYRYKNIAINDPRWDYYRRLHYTTLRDQIRRIDTPLKVGVIIAKRLILSVGIVPVFHKINAEWRYNFAGQWFRIKDDVNASYRKNVQTRLIGVGWQRKRLLVNLDYDFPPQSLHSPILFEGELYPFRRQTGVWSLSVGYAVFSNKPLIRSNQD